MRQKDLEIKHAFLVDVGGKDSHNFLYSMLLYSIFGKELLELGEGNFLVRVACYELECIFNVG